MRQLPLYIFQCEPHHESASGKVLCFLLSAACRVFLFLYALPLEYFGSTLPGADRFISFIGTCQVRGAHLLAWRCVSCEKRATAQIAHLVFAHTQANAEKTKRAIFCQRSNRPTRKRTKSILKNNINGNFGLFSYSNLNGNEPNKRSA